MKQLFDIQKRFRFTVYILLIIAILLLVFDGWVYYQSLMMVEQSREKIYVLDNGQSLLLALRKDVQENRSAEARNHIKRFHELFFTLEPDREYIEKNIREALYLADRSAIQQYRSFKESNLYNRIVASDISMTLMTDSVHIDFSTTPHAFVFYGRQKIVRSSNITIRNLESKGVLRNTSRTDHNTHGFLIEQWRITNNKDLETFKRKKF